MGGKASEINYCSLQKWDKVYFRNMNVSTSNLTTIQSAIKGCTENTDHN